MADLRNSAEARSVFSVLAEDVSVCKKRLRAEPSQFWSRIYIRSLLALFDTTGFLLRRLALVGYDHGDLHFTPQQLAVLEETIHYLDDRGNLKERTHNVPSHVLFKFTVEQICSRCGKPDLATEVFSATGWDCVKRAMEHRDALMHPKAFESINMTPEQLDIAIQAESWILSTADRVLDALIDHAKA